MIPIKTPLIVVADTRTQVDEAILRLARVGHESVKGFLEGGMKAWKGSNLETASVPQISVDELHERLEHDAALQLIDVRRPAEYADGHAPRAVNLPLAPQLREQAAQFDLKLSTAVICAGGYRSSAATSLLERCGFAHLFNVAGGTSAWINAGYPVEK